MPVDPTNPPNYITNPDAAIPVYVVSGVATQPVATVDLLPSPIAGTRSFVSDSVASAIGNFGEEVTGLGTYTVPVWADGANWLIG
jgi:hypothetical protein